MSGRAQLLGIGVVSLLALASCRALLSDDPSYGGGGSGGSGGNGGAGGSGGTGGSGASSSDSTGVGAGGGGGAAGCTMPATASYVLSGMAFEDHLDELCTWPEAPTAGTFAVVGGDLRISPPSRSSWWTPWEGVDVPGPLLYRRFPAGIDFVVVTEVDVIPVDTAANSDPYRMAGLIVRIPGDPMSGLGTWVKWEWGERTNAGDMGLVAGESDNEMQLFNLLEMTRPIQLAVCRQGGTLRLLYSTDGGTNFIDAMAETAHAALITDEVEVGLTATDHLDSGSNAGMFGELRLQTSQPNPSCATAAQILAAQ